MYKYYLQYISWTLAAVTIALFFISEGLRMASSFWLASYTPETAKNATGRTNIVDTFLDILGLDSDDDDDVSGLQHLARGSNFLNSSRAYHRNEPRQIEFGSPYAQNQESADNFDKTMFLGVYGALGIAFGEIFHTRRVYVHDIPSQTGNFNIPSQPLTLNRFAQKWPFLREPGIFRIGNPPHTILYPQKPLGGTYFHGRHGHGLGAINKKRSSKFP